MAKVTFMPGIVSISGKLGDTIYRKTATGKTIAYKAPQRRLRPPTRKEIKQRNRFALVCHVVNLLLVNPAHNAKHTRKPLRRTPWACTRSGSMYLSIFGRYCPNKATCRLRDHLATTVSYPYPTYSLSFSIQNS